MGRFGIFISLFIAAVFSSCAGRSAEDMTVSFYVSDPTADEVVLVYHNTATFFKLDESGHAEAALKGMDAVYAKLFYGRDSKMIYLEEGDDVKISFEGRNFKET
ncbi:MAG: TlpA family protein disulfide reductase, partial [Bacteroidales bacterium]|nr:TlpA family protein disulfide reductase [Bacteroidales bacterium]